MEAKRDQNHITVALGYDAENDVTLPLRVDPVTDELLIEIQPRPTYVPTATPSIAERDENHVTTTLAVTDDANLTEQIPAVNKVSGLLWVQTT